MGVKVDRNARVVLDLEAIWMICSRLDISMNHRSPATATFKAQLVTETPAIEMDKQCVFEQDRSLKILDQFLGFEKFAVAIGPIGPIGPVGPIGTPSITCPAKLEAKNHCLFFGEKSLSPMAPTSRCSFALQSRGSAAEKVPRAVVSITTAGSGRLISGYASGLDSNATTKVGDCGTLPDLGLCVLSSRQDCRNFSEVPRVRQSMLLLKVFSRSFLPGRIPPLLAARYSFAPQNISRAIERTYFNRVVSRPFPGRIPPLLAARYSFAPQNISRAIERTYFNRVVFHTTGAVSGGLNRATLGFDKNVTTKAGDFGSLLAELALDVLRARLKCRNCSEVPRACTSYVPRSEVMVKEDWMQLYPEKQVCVGPCFRSFRKVEAARPFRASALSHSQAGEIGLLLARKPFRAGGAELESSRDFFEACKLFSAWLLGLRDNRSEPPTILYPERPPMVGRKEAMVKGNWKQAFSAKAVSSSESWKNFRMTPPAARCSFGLQRSGAVDVQGFHGVALFWRSMTFQGDASSEASRYGGHVMCVLGAKCQVAGVLGFRRGQENVMGRYPFHFHMMGTVSDSFFEDCAVLHSFFRAYTVHGTSFSRVSRNVAYDVSESAYLEDGNEVDARLRQRPRLKKIEARNPSKSSRKNFSMTLLASRCSFALQNRSRAGERADFNRAMVKTTRAVSGGLTGVSTPGLESNVIMKAGACGALLSDLRDCVFMALLERRHFFEVDARLRQRTRLNKIEARNPSKSSRKNFSMTLLASRCSFALQNKSRAGERADFNRAMRSSAVWKRGRKRSDNLDHAMQPVVKTTRAVSGGLIGVSTPGLDSNVIMKAGDCGALLSDLGLCVFRARLERRHFSAAMVKRNWKQPLSAKQAGSSSESWKNFRTPPAARCIFALQNKSRAIERTYFNRVVFHTTGAVSGGLTRATLGFDKNVTMKVLRACVPCTPFRPLKAVLDWPAATLECETFKTVTSCVGVQLDETRTEAALLQVTLQGHWNWKQPFAMKEAIVPALHRDICMTRSMSRRLQVTLQRHWNWKQPFAMKEAIVPALHRDIWMTRSMSRRCYFRCSFVLVVQKEEPEDILEAAGSVFRPMSWSRRFKALDSDSDCQLCGPPVSHCARHDPLHLNDVWTPLKHAESAETSESLSCHGLPMGTGLAMEDVRKEQVELRKGCRLLTVQSKERYPLSAGGSTARRTSRTQPTKRRKEVLCDVTEKTGESKRAVKVVGFGGAVHTGNTRLPFAGMDLAGLPNDGLNQLDLGSKLALQNPMESVLIQKGAMLQDCEPEELVVLTLSYGGNTAYRLASSIERATGRAVRGVVMWDFMAPFGRLVQGPPVFESVYRTASMKDMENFSQTAVASPAFRCSCEHPIQMMTGSKTGELAMDLMIDRQRAESAIKVMYKKLQIQKVEECHFGYERSNWDMLRLILSTRPPKKTTDAAAGD